MQITFSYAEIHCRSSEGMNPSARIPGEASAAAVGGYWGWDESAVLQTQNNSSSINKGAEWDWAYYGGENPLMPHFGLRGPPEAEPKPQTIIGSALPSSSSFPLPQIVLNSAVAPWSHGVKRDPEDLQASTIGLNLGARTYFSSPAPGANFCRRPRANSPGSAQIPRCQAEGCKANLANAKHYHRRHRVCELHSKASTVTAGGLIQRFCQQCSRFHVISEFDEGKRSCRKRLADHNRRRRKRPPAETGSGSAGPAMSADGDNRPKPGGGGGGASGPDFAGAVDRSLDLQKSRTSANFDALFSSSSLQTSPGGSGAGWGCMGNYNAAPQVLGFRSLRDLIPGPANEI